MNARLSTFMHFVAGDAQADRVVPPTGYTARLTVFAAASMAFLAVFALALSLATGRVADRWGEALAKSSTIRINAPVDQMDAQVLAVMEILATTPGIKNARPLGDDEQRALLEPWFGPDLPLDQLPIPKLIEVIEDADGFDAEGLRARLAGEAPGAILDDHTRWREPLVRAAKRLRALGIVAIVLIAALSAVGSVGSAGGKRTGDPCFAPCWCARQIYRTRLRPSLYTQGAGRCFGRHNVGHVGNLFDAFGRRSREFSDGAWL